MKLRTVLIAVAVLIVALVATGIAIIMSTDFNRFRPVVAAQVKDATGRDLDVAGDIEVAVSLVPTVQVSNVTFANAPWGSRPEMMKVERLEVEMELLPLISGDIRVRRIVLVGADILLETDESGTPNWVFAASEAGEETAVPEPADGPVLPTVSSVAIENASLTYRDGRTGESQSLVLDSLSADAADAASPISIDLAGSVNDNPIAMRGSIGAIQSVIADQAFPVDLTGEAGGATFSAKGEIARPASMAGLVLNLTAEGASLADLSGIAGQDLPPLGPYKLAATVSDVTDGGYKLEGVQVRLGQSDLSGNAGIVLSGPRPSIQAAFASTRIDLQDFGIEPATESAGTEAPDSGGDGRIFPDDPLPFDGLQAIDASIKFTGQEVIKAPVTLDNVGVELTLEAGKLSLGRLEAGVSGGSLTATGVVDASQPVPSVSAKLVSRQVEAGSLLTTLGLTEVLSGGKVDMDVDVSGSGASVREIMGGLDGTTNVEMGAGRINNRFAEIVLADLVKLLSFGGTGDSSNLNCMVARFDIENGLARSDGLVLDTNGATILGSGDIHLDSEQLDMRFEPNAKETNLVNLAIPVQVRGTLAQPSVTPDPAALAKGIAGAAAGAATGAGVFGALAGLTSAGGTDGATASGENPCVAALAEAGTAPASKSTTEQILDGAGGALEGAGDAAKGAADALKGLFD